MTEPLDLTDVYKGDLTVAMPIEDFKQLSMARIQIQERQIEQLERRIERLRQPPLPGQHTTDEHLLLYTRPDSYISPKYQVLIYKDGVRIPEREPVFIIRGQDATSAPFVRQWLQTNENTLAHDVVIQIRRIVWEMDRYEPKKLAS